MQTIAILQVKCLQFIINGRGQLADNIVCAVAPFRQDGKVVSVVVLMLYALSYLWKYLYIITVSFTTA